MSPTPLSKKSKYGHKPAGNDLFFKGSEICSIVGLTRRQLQHWDRIGLIGPAYKTRGGHGRYTFQDLIAYKTAKKLLDAGITLQRLRRSIAELRRLLPKINRPLEELTLVATGDVVLVFYEGTAFEALSGQEWILEIGEIQRDVQRWQNKLRKVSKHRRVSTVRSGGKDVVKVS
ncbi:MAG: MerR family transcriptional regulator [Nitrospirae bacterium]|nr:MerR family transcriptional regulator [Nitrospirota bacterium]